MSDAATESVTGENVQSCFSSVHKVENEISYIGEPKQTGNNTSEVENEADDTKTKQVKRKTSSERNETDDDPFAYLDRGDFTSEKFKIELKGLPKFYGLGQLRKLLNETLQLRSNKVKPMRQGGPFAFACFRSEEDRNQALKVLNGYKWKGKVLKAMIARPCPDPLVRKRKSGNADGLPNKVPCRGDLEKRIKDSVAPLWNLRYEEQLAQKEKAVREQLLRWSQETYKANQHLRLWLKDQKKKFDGLPCELRPIVPSPVLTEYRNKCEFSIGFNDETGEPTVGFRIGRYANGCAGVAPADSLNTVHERMKEVARVFEMYVRESPLGVFNPETHEGVWRQLLVRLATNGQLLIVIGLNPAPVEASVLNTLKQELHDFFSDGAGAALQANSVFLDLFSPRGTAAISQRMVHVKGDTCIYETVCGLTFRISPEAFFQINTPAAEVLYNTVAELSGASDNTTVLDVCCGTGTIGLCMAKQCDQVIGVEISEKAVEDAKANAERNNITNCEFFAGSAEDLLTPMIQRARNENIVAMVDPPRAGLHQKAMTVIRNTKNLNRLVYVSCDAKAAMNNFILLARPVSKTFSLPPFVPMCAVPVDLFPHTPHCELVIYFERVGYKSPKELSDLVRKVNEEENVSDPKNEKSIEDDSMKGEKEQKMKVVSDVLNTEGESNLCVNDKNIEVEMKE